MGGSGKKDCTRWSSKIPKRQNRRDLLLSETRGKREQIKVRMDCRRSLACSSNIPELHLTKLCSRECSNVVRTKLWVVNRK